MADLLPIAPAPVAPNLNINLGRNADGAPGLPTTNAELVNLSDLTKIIRNTDVSEDLGEQRNNADRNDGGNIPLVNTYSQKDSNAAVRTLRTLLAHETRAMFEESGDSELLNKITEFANEIMLKAGNLPADLISQQNKSTLFGGDFWKMVNNLLRGRNINTGILPSPSDNQALPANPESPALQLTKTLDPLTTEQLKAAISDKKLAAALPRGEAFQSAVLNLLKSASAIESKDDIINSIAANLKYLALDAAPSLEVRNQLLTVADNLSQETIPVLKGAILTLLGKVTSSPLMSNTTKNLVPLTIYNLSRYNPDNKSLSDSFNEVIKLADPETAKTLKQAFVNYVENSEMTADDKAAVLNLSGIPAAKSSMTLISERLADAIMNFTENLSAAELEQKLSIPDEKAGIDELKKALGEITPENMKGALNTVFREFAKTSNLNDLIRHLSIIINKFPDTDKRAAAATAFNPVLENLSKQSDVNYKPPTAAENFTDFLNKNINDPQLKSLSAMSPGDMVRTMLFAPSAVTPLLHMMAPLQSGALKAYGEMWADPEAAELNPDGKSKSHGGADSCSHVFLVFDIEDAGYFEMELYARDKDLSVMLLCPSAFCDTMNQLIDKMPTIAESQGYNVKNTIIDKVLRRRDLPDVFPKLQDTAATLNVTA
ncbi:MAG: hypothetical protein LBM87_08345 [Ruminococcus sp.]|jgi:hypothetical protein|nr:hypothetical protein [Ruminococcus sp.]